MTKYDLTVLIDVSKGEEHAKECQGKIENIITSTGGKIFSVTNDGRKDLVNTFRKYRQAFHLRFQYEGANQTLDALAKEYKINESIIRQLNLKLDTVLSPTKIEELVK